MVVLRPHTQLWKMLLLFAWLFSTVGLTDGTHYSEKLHQCESLCPVSPTSLDIPMCGLRNFDVRWKMAPFLEYPKTKKLLASGASSSPLTPRPRALLRLQTHERSPAPNLLLHHWIRLKTPQQCVLSNLRNNAKFRENSKLRQFKVIQSHRPWCQSKAHKKPALGLLFIIVTGRFSYGFRDILIFWCSKLENGLFPHLILVWRPTDLKLLEFLVETYPAIEGWD